MPLREIRRRPAAWRRHLFPIFFALCAAATVLPLWLVRHLPVEEWPRQLGLVRELARLHADAGGADAPFAAYFTAAWPASHLAVPHAAWILSRFMAPEAALKAILSLSVLLIPLCLLFLSRSLGRSRWLSLLAFPLSFSAPFFLGDLDFMAALPFAFLSLGFTVRILESASDDPDLDEFRWTERKNLALMAGATTSLAVAALADPTAMALAIPGILLLTALTPADGKRRKAAFAASLPGSLLALAWLASEYTSPRGAGPTLLQLDAYAFHTPLQRLQSLPENLFGAFQGMGLTPALAGWLAALVATVVLAFRHPQDPSSDSVRPRLRPLALFAVAAVLYFALPFQWAGRSIPAYPSMAPAMALLLLPVLPFPKGRSFQPLAVLFTLLTLATAGGASHLLISFDKEAADFEPMKSLVPPGARVMPLIADSRGSVASRGVYAHYGHLLAMDSQGIAPHFLAAEGGRAVAAVDDAKFRVPEPPEPAFPLKSGWRKAADWYDVYLVRAEAEMAPEQLFGKEARRLEALGSSGAWSLWRPKGAKPPRAAPVQSSRSRSKPQSQR